MRFGLALPHYDTSLAGRQASWDAVKRVALTAERVGFNSVWVSDHLFLDWGKYGGPGTAQGSLECWTTMSALAAVTERVRIGSLVLNNDFRNPALLAKMAATLDLLSGGRLDLGMGAGWYHREYGAGGFDFSSPLVRIKRLGEAAEIAGRLLAGEELTFDGEHYSLDGALCRPGPLQKPRPPIWIGGKGEFLVRTAARVADGWNFSWLGSLEDYRAKSAEADRACEKHGRDPSSLRRSVGAYVTTGADEADLKARMERLRSVSPEGVLPTEGDGAEVSWEEFRRTRIAGTTGQVAEALGALDELGVEEVIVTLGAVPFQVADEEDVELFGAEVIPALS